MIDWSLAKNGAVAIHRNGVRSVIKKYMNLSGIRVHYIHNLSFDEGFEVFTDIGRTTEWRNSPFDIIAIEAAPEPVQVKLYFSSEYIDTYGATPVLTPQDTHVIIFNIIDCKPDCASVKMEQIK